MPSIGQAQQTIRHGSALSKSLAMWRGVEKEAASRELAARLARRSAPDSECSRQARHGRQG
jgi:hypothetical protein